MSYSHLTLEDQIAQTEQAIRDLESEAFEQRLIQRMGRATLPVVRAQAEREQAETVTDAALEEQRLNLAAGALRAVLAELQAQQAPKA